MQQLLRAAYAWPHAAAAHPLESQNWEFGFRPYKARYRHENFEVPTHDPFNIHMREFSGPKFMDFLPIGEKGGY
jgi:hypothetical protein